MNCHQHLTKDLERRLNGTQNNHRFDEEQARKMKSKVFGTDRSLGNAKNIAAFDTRHTDALQTAGHYDPNDDYGLQSYLNDVLFPKMRTNVEIAQSIPEMDLFKLTNNATESLNNILKFRQKHQKVSLTKFASIMREHEYDFRIHETRRAILGRGSYDLTGYFKSQFDWKVTEWYSFSTQNVLDTVKEDAFMKKFQQTHLPLNYRLGNLGLASRSTSSDGRLLTSVPGKRAGKKPGTKQSASKHAKRARRN